MSAVHCPCMKAPLQSHIHAAGQSIPEVRTKASTSSTEPKSEDVKWTGKMRYLGNLAKTIDRSSNDFIREGKKKNFPVFSEVPDAEERTRKRLAKHFIEQM